MTLWLPSAKAQAAGTGAGGGAAALGSSAKSVSNISHRFDGSKVIPWSYSPPPPIHNLQFTVAQLSASVARAAALSSASAALVQALSDGAQRLLIVLLDASQTPLTFTSEVEEIGDANRTAFSGNLGAGVTDLYLMALGYVYRCNGRELIKTGGKVCDFIYDGPPTQQSGVVLAEAKGSIAANTNLASVMRTAQGGYLSQVFPHVGTIEPISSLRLLHGYAVGIGTQPRPIPCVMHVEETGLAGAAAPVPGSPAGGGGSGGAPGPSLPFNPGSSGGLRSGGGPGGYSRPDVRVALPNFRAVFRMLGAEQVVEAIDFVSTGSAPAKAAPQDFLVVRWRDDFFATTSLVPPIMRGSQIWSHVPFGLRMDVTMEFLKRLQGMSGMLSAGQFPFELPIRSMDLQAEIKWDDGGAELPDGLASFGPRPRTLEAGTVRWDPSEGFSERGSVVKGAETYSLPEYFPARPLVR